MKKLMGIALFAILVTALGVVAFAAEAKAPDRPSNPGAEQSRPETDAEKAARKAKLEAEYNALPADEKALVDEIRAAFPCTQKNELSDAEKQALKEKRKAVIEKIKALTDEQRERLKDFLPMRKRPGKGPQQGGNCRTQVVQTAQISPQRPKIAAK